MTVEEPAGFTAATGLPFPLSTQGPADIPNYIQRLAEATEKLVVGIFASSAARTTAWPSPTEGQVSYLKDTNTLAIYDGSTWVSMLPVTYSSVATGHITGGTAAPSGGADGDIYFKYA